MLVKGIRQLAAESTNAPYPLLVERWLRKEFYSMENLRGVITIKDLKAFLPKINLKLATNRLKEFFQDVDTRRVGEIGFEGFASFYHNLIHDEQLFSGTFGQYTKDGQRVTLQEFQNFLLEQQKVVMSEKLSAGDSCATPGLGGLVVKSVFQNLYLYRHVYPKLGIWLLPVGWIGMREALLEVPSPHKKLRT
ncbi:hypothetical protein AVEN_134340-2 [Araneus ventricosus]|uniref:PLCG1 EF-hand domain-containing protein n=1 Tax=Araneus ventricosus TaxID=182803 RepID=A0A4Y2NWI3_ARAVE|nr:hypothetical protein AVEN_134340-2 [Araneus ventricosus]